MPNLVVLDQQTRALSTKAMNEHRSALQPSAGWNHRVGEKDTLIPADECRAVVARINHDLEPAGDTERTASCVELLTGAFPFTKKSADDLESADIWLSAITAIYAENPAALHERATVEILKRCEYRPKVFDVNQVFEELRGSWMIARHTAEKHLKEHKRRQQEAERKALLEAEYPKRDEFVVEMTEKYGTDAVKFAQAAMTDEPKDRTPYSEKAEEEAELKQFAQDRHDTDRKVEELKAQNETHQQKAAE